jgi:mannose-6-phosphate isomerase-like protein (cupin superfamily)
MTTRIKLNELRTYPQFSDCVQAPRPILSKGWGSETFVFHQAPLCSEYDGKKVSKLEKNPIFTKDLDVKTVKILSVEKGKRGSVHFHMNKDEIFYVLQGQLDILLIKDGFNLVLCLVEGDCIRVRPGVVHQITGVDDTNKLLEVSTLDSASDSYRIERGD